jgi:molybdate transport system substrate-binding protein
VRRPVATLVVVAIALAACGSSGSPQVEIDVSAATSLREALSSYADGFRAARVRLTFAGSEAVAEGIRAGARPDVFAAAESEAPDELYAEGLVEQPVLFAGNDVVLAVPRGSTSIRRIEDLAVPGVRLAVAGTRVSLGRYTRDILHRLEPTDRHAIEANIRTSPPDVGAVVSGIAHHDVDAGFVYRSDVRASRGRLRAITLPARLQPSVVYKAAIVRGTRHHEQASAFVDGLRSGAGRRALLAAGFQVP